ncbi:MAG TPA: energy transducer TonB [Pyrinomonadaceae bacterium]|nr:energy transducer TonB [Pyrinomonadaceae bacterium]
MSKKRRMLLTTCCLLALLANGVGAFAQKQTQERMPPPPPPEVETQRLIVLAPGQAPEGAPPINTMTEGLGDAVGFTIISDGMNFAGPVVKGAPYSGEAVTESTQTLADGNRITHKSTALIYRDSEGRTRREQTLSNVGPFATNGDAPNVIFINDPVAGANYTLDPRSKTVRKGGIFNLRVGPPADGQGPPHDMMWSTPSPDAPPPVPPGGLLGAAVKRVEPVYSDAAKAAGAEGPVTVQIVIDEQGNVTSARAVSGNPLLQAAAVDAARQWVFKPAGGTGRAAKVSATLSFNFRLDKHGEELSLPAPRGPKPVRESLGTQNIEGVAAEGTRFTVTLPAGSVGNEQPINIVDEHWFSSELHTLVMSKHSDPRFGETTYRLTNINRSEPAHSLFEVPADYTIKQGEPMRREFRMRKPDNEQ